MAERPGPSPENQKSELTRATEAISALIKANQAADAKIQGYIGHDALTQRSEQWIDTARSSPSFFEPALDLLDAVQHAAVIRDIVPDVTRKAMNTHFSVVENQNARTLLTDILYGHIDSSTNLAPRIGTPQVSQQDILRSQANQIAKDLTTDNILKDGKRVNQLKEITLDKVVGAVLTGKLKLPRTQV
jgi:hypothetical protein